MIGPVQYQLCDVDPQMPGEGEGLSLGGQAINLGPYPDTAWEFHGGSRGVFPLMAGGGSRTRRVLREGGQVGAGRGGQEGKGP
jgi:hypothetical protein